MRAKSRTASRARSLTRPALLVITRRASSHRCPQTAIRVINQPLRKNVQVLKEFSRMRCRNPRLTIHSSNTTIAITRGFPVCYATVVKTIHRNRRCRAKLHMHLARVVMRSSSQIQRARSARSVTQTRRVERSKRFHRCAALMRASITRSTVARLVPLVTGGIVAVLGSRFPRG